MVGRFLIPAAIGLVVCSVALTAAAGPVTIDFNGWQPTGHADGGQIAGTGLEGPGGEKIFYFNGTWDAGAASHRPNDILTVPTVPHGTYSVDIHEGTDKDIAFTTDENGHLDTLQGNGVKTGTVSRIGPSGLRFNTIEVLWKSDADPNKIIARDRSHRTSAPAGTIVLPIGKWHVHWWGMRNYGKAPAANIDFDFTVRADGVEMTELVVHGGTPDPAILYIAAGEAALPLRAVVLSAQRVAFEDVTAAMGLEADPAKRGSGNHEAYWVDFNNDGWVDLQAGALWRSEAGTEFVKVHTGGMYNSWGDIDNDGWLDFVGGASGAMEFGSENGSFTMLRHALPDRPHGLSDGGALLDFDGDGLLDFWWSGYEDWGVVSAYPDGLYRNQGNRTFTLQRVTREHARASRGTTACDFDNDGDTDVYVTNYRLQANQLWVNDTIGGDDDHNGSFTERAAAYGVTGGNGHGIGSAWGDIDNDGLIDLFAGNFAHAGQPQSRFLRNLGPEQGYRFEDMGTCGIHYQESYASPALGDYDNDGDLDLYFSTVYPHNTGALFRNDGGWRFRHVTHEAGLGNISSSYQAAWGDYDNDGDLDLMAGGRLWRNTLGEADAGMKGNWLRVKLQGAGIKASPEAERKAASVNRAAIGAQVRIRLKDSFDKLRAGKTLTRQVESATGRGNMNELTLHFGLGMHDGEVELEITWPYTEKKQTVTAAANSLVVVTFNLVTR